MTKAFVGLAGLLLASTTLASAASAETLLEAMASAYQNNPTLLAGRAQLRATDEAVPQALSGWRPQVSITAEAARSRLYADTTAAATTGSSYVTPLQAALQVQQPVYTAGRVGAAVKAAENSVLAGRAQLTAIEQDVLFQVVQAYMNVLSGQALVDLTRKNVEVLQRQLEAAQDRFRVGEITRTDVAQAEARRAEAAAQRVEAEGNLQAARANYQAVVGRSPVNLVSPDFAVNMPDNLEQAVALAADENPSVTAQTFAALAAENGVDQQEAELFPEVSLFASSARLYDQTVEDTRSDVVTAGLSVTVPLYTAGATYAAIREQKHVANQRRIQVHESRRAAVEAATAAWETWQSSRAAIVALRTQIGAAETALEGVQREAQVGARTVLDVLDAERELLNARVQLVQSQSDEKVAAFRLMQAVGRLTAPALGLPTELYDPTDHYMEVRGKWFGTDADLIPENQ